MIAYWCAVFLAGVLVGIVLGGAYALREARREYEDRLRLARRYRQVDAGTLNRQLLEAAAAVRAALADLEQRAVDYAKAERAYRLAKATAYLATSGTVAEREAHAEAAVNELRYQRDLAEGLKVSALEAVRSHRGVLSAVQTLARLYEQEASFDRTGPEAAA